MMPAITMNYSELIQLYFERSTAMQNYWNFMKFGRMKLIIQFSLPEILKDYLEVFG